MAKHLTMAELEAGMESILKSPRDNGVLEMIVRRPQIDAREIVQEAQLDQTDGLVGDGWRARIISRKADELVNSATQLTIMNSRVIALLAQDRGRWPLAGDQLYIELDLSTENLPPGTRLALGTAVVEVTAQPHTGCKKFVSRYGQDAMMFVNSAVGRQLNLRGIYTEVVKPGVIRVGDIARKEPAAPLSSG